MRRYVLAAICGALIALFPPILSALGKASIWHNDWMPLVVAVALPLGGGAPGSSRIHNWDLSLVNQSTGLLFLMELLKSDFRYVVPAMAVPVICLRVWDRRKARRKLTGRGEDRTPVTVGKT